MSRPSKIGLVGLGYWGPNLLRNLVAAIGGSEIVAIDHRVDRRAAVCANYPAVSEAASLEEALEKHELAGVVVATPVTTHYELARMALEAGCHVMVEKPLAASSEDARSLVELADLRGLTLMVGHTFLFSPRVERICELVAEGRLGRVQYVTSSRLNLGLHQADVSVIWDLAPHDFSIIFRVLGEFPESVHTSGRAMVRHDRLDVAFVNLTFPSGIVASVSVSWLAPSKARSTVLVGDRQMLVFDDIDNEQPIKLYDKGVVLSDSVDFGEHQLTYRFGDMLAPHVPAREPLARQVEHFIACSNGFGECVSDGWFGLGVVQALEAAEQSWALGGAAVDIAPVDRPLVPAAALA